MVKLDYQKLSFVVDVNIVLRVEIQIWKWEASVCITENADHCPLLVLSLLSADKKLPFSLNSVILPKVTLAYWK